MNPDLLTTNLREQLLRNGAAQEKAQAAGEDIDFRPVVKLFTPDAQATWLLSELYPNDPDLAFGLCDLGVGPPELGDVRLSEIEAFRGPNGLPVERDMHFRADKTISEYAIEAEMAGRLHAS
jgi:hypothetical protein